MRGGTGGEILPPPHLTVVELRAFRPSHSPSALPPDAISTGNPYTGADATKRKEHEPSALSY